MTDLATYRVPYLPWDYRTNLINGMYYASNTLRKELLILNQEGFRKCRPVVDMFVTVPTAAAMMLMTEDEVRQWANTGVFEIVHINDDYEHIEVERIFQFIINTHGIAGADGDDNEEADASETD